MCESPFSIARWSIVTGSCSANRYASGEVLYGVNSGNVFRKNSISHSPPPNDLALYIIPSFGLTDDLSGHFYDIWYALRSYVGGW